MASYEVHSIGTIQNKGDETFLQIDSNYIPALTALDGFSHIQVLWWFSDFDSKEARSVLQTPKPYKNAPEQMGIFATRSPVRPNPIALTTVQVLHINNETGLLQIDYIDANDHTPILDIKPYTPSLDRVENPEVPNWCKEWPKCIEESGSFPWEEVFNF